MRFGMEIALVEVADTHNKRVQAKFVAGVFVLISMFLLLLCSSLSLQF